LTVQKTEKRSTLAEPMSPNSFSLAPSALSTFAASLTALPTEEIRKAKSLFIRNAIADYEMTISSSRGMVIK
jgi:hypothetical protein